LLVLLVLSVLGQSNPAVRNSLRIDLRAHTDEDVDSGRHRGPWLGHGQRACRNDTSQSCVVPSLGRRAELYGWWWWWWLIRDAVLSWSLLWSRLSAPTGRSAKSLSGSWFGGLVWVRRGALRFGGKARGTASWAWLAEGKGVVRPPFFIWPKQNHIGI
jgi:hypothetical protein